jgi:hypothetical protein
LKGYRIIENMATKNDEVVFRLIETLEVWLSLKKGGSETNGRASKSSRIGLLTGVAGSHKEV